MEGSPHIPVREGVTSTDGVNLQSPIGRKSALRMSSSDQIRDPEISNGEIIAT